MTSIAHPVLPGAVPAIGGATTGSASSEESRWLRPAGSKAVRLGLGVAIAAVMAGDVYAVLRSPAAEGRGVGSAAASGVSLEDGSGAGSAYGSTAGHVATNPFGEAAWGASTALGSGGPAFVVRAASAAPAAGPASSSIVPPASGAPGIVLPSMPAAPALTQTGPASSNDGGNGPQNGDQGGDQAPQASPLSEAVAPVLQTVVETVPEAAPVAQVVSDVVDSVPTTAPEPVSSSVPHL